MGKIHVRNGTPVGSSSLCESCSHAHIMRGYRESELLVYCDYTARPILVPFKLVQCSNHCDVNRPSWDQMEKLALDVQPVSSAKPAGFKVMTTRVHDLEHEDEEVSAEI